MTILRNVTIAYNFDHKQDIDPAFDYISEILLSTLTNDCGLTVRSEEINVNSTTEFPQENSPYIPLREHYSQSEAVLAPEPYVSMRSLTRDATSQEAPYSRYTS